MIDDTVEGFRIIRDKARELGIEIHDVHYITDTRIAIYSFRKDGKPLAVVSNTDSAFYWLIGFTPKDASGKNENESGRGDRIQSHVPSATKARQGR
jgi:hypothetical protein